MSIKQRIETPDEKYERERDQTTNAILEASIKSEILKLDWQHRKALDRIIAKAQRDMLTELKAIGTDGIETEADELHVRIKLLSHIQALIDKLNKVIGGK